MKYFVRVGGRVLEVVIDGEDVTIDGRRVSASIEAVPDTPELRLRIDGTVHRLAVDGRRPEEGWRIIDQGTVHDVEAIDERTQHIRSLTGTAATSSGGAVVKAPMPGLVVRVLVGEGDPVEKGDALVVLEAMKMENELRAPAAGVVVGLKVAPGQVVEKGQVLVELEGSPD